MRILCVYYVVALRRFVVAFNSFRANWDCAQRYFIRFENFVAGQQRHGASGLYDHDFVGLNGGCDRYAMECCGQKNQETNASMKHTRSRIVYAEAALGIPLSAPNLTETILETPGSCMVTPYITGAIDIVFLLWVMMMNCVCTAISRISSVKRPMLASSSGASTSSRMQKGLG